MNSECRSSHTTAPASSRSRTDPWSPAGPSRYRSGASPAFSIENETVSVYPGSTTSLLSAAMHRTEPSGDVPVIVADVGAGWLAIAPEDAGPAVDGEGTGPASVSEPVTVRARIATAPTSATSATIETAAVIGLDRRGRFAPGSRD